MKFVDSWRDVCLPRGLFVLLTNIQNWCTITSNAPRLQARLKHQHNTYDTHKPMLKLMNSCRRIADCVVSYILLCLVSTLIFDLFVVLGVIPLFVNKRSVQKKSGGTHTTDTRVFKEFPVFAPAAPASPMIVLTVDNLASKAFTQKALANPLQLYSVLSFFFGVDMPNDALRLRQGAAVTETMQPLWYAGGPSYDALCQPFQETIRRAGRRELTEWNSSVDGLMAQLILTDQLARNVFRSSPEAFGFEDVSLELARNLGNECRKAEDARVVPGEFYPPYLGFIATGLMHSEVLADQHDSLKVLNHGKEKFPDMEDTWNYQIQFATDHKDVVERFGRFPHRNKLKNRESSPEEEAWLNDKDNLPGWAKSQG